MRVRGFVGVATARSRWPDVIGGVSLFALVHGTGCSSPPPAAPVAPSATPAPTGAPAAKDDVRSRLQGTWQLTGFQSMAVPDEAAPILGRLHGAVQLRFEGDQVTTLIPGTSDEEKCPFEIADESGGSFTLITGLGMFRRAQARFVSDDVWEATENGPLWPGTTRFARVKP